MSDAPQLAFRGTWTALTTPFLDTPGFPVDFEALERLVDAQIEAGVDVLVPCGTTGESPTLSHEEHDAVVQCVVRRAAGRAPVVAGTGSNSTDEALRLTAHACEAGVSGVLVVAPYYNRPSQRMLEEYYVAVAEASRVPVVLYNVPSRTGVDVLPETVAAIRERTDNVAAVKSAAGSVDRVSRLRTSCDVAVLSGDDALTVPMMAVGASGVISVASNALPRRVCEVVNAALEGDWNAARAGHARMHPFYRACFVEPNPVPVKAAQRLLGRGNGVVRRPLLPALAPTEDLMRAELARLGALSAPAS